MSGDLKSKRGGHPGCTKVPSSGTMGDNDKRECCSSRKRYGMVNLRKKRCDHPGCIQGAGLWRGWQQQEAVMLCSQDERVGGLKNKSLWSHPWFQQAAVIRRG